MQMTIGAKVTAGFAVALALLVGLGYSARIAIGSIEREVNQTVHVTGKAMELGAELQTDVRDMKVFAAKTQFSFVMNRLVPPNPKAGAVLECSMCHSLEPRETSERQLRDLVAKIETSAARLQPLMGSGQSKNPLGALRTNVRDYVSMFGEYLTLVERNQYDDAHAVLRDRMFPLIGVMDKSLTDLHQEQRAALQRSSDRARDTVSRSQNVILVLIVISLLVASAVLYIVRGSVLTLRRLADEVRKGADEVAGAATQVATSSMAMSQGSCEHAAALEETSASTEEIGAVARQNNDNCRLAVEMVTDSQLKFQQTKESLDQAVLAMAAIAASSDRISKIIKVIDEIAFQTNILALNAAVEAARAGESGLGFAVVADEVRRLAQRCADAANDTTSLIEDSIAKSNDGKAMVDHAAHAVRVTTEESDKVRLLVKEVSLGSEEQSRGLDQIGKAIAQMERTTQGTAAGAEQNSAAAEQLNSESRALKDVVGRLNILVGRG
jgi:methyl-accepting chemotaxis protein/methyl-accepting chemotaxis protein-1 (serine sensor receptor)